MTVNRDTYWRVFSTELNSATYEIKQEEEKKPSFQLSRLGAMINHVLITGILTEKENIGTEDEPMWRGRVQDVSGGTVFINISRYQQDAASTIAFLDTPCLVTLIGKVRSYTNEEGRTFVSVRPERIIQSNDDLQKAWLYDAAKGTWERLKAMKIAMGLESLDPEALSKNAKIPHELAQNICTAISQYGTPESVRYLKSIQYALQSVLPERNIDFGLAEDVVDAPDEIVLDSDSEPSSAPTQKQSADPGKKDKEDLILSLLSELDDGKGTPRDLLESRAAEEGIPSMELEEIIEGLLDKGLAYEPNMKYIKKIDD